MTRRGRTALGAAFGAALGLVGCAWPGPVEAAGPRDGRAHRQGRHHAGSKAHGAPAQAHAGRAQTGKASVYSSRLSGRKMADGTRFDPASDTAASKTLPLGTTARVTNLENGRATVVKVRDRGPHVRGRIVDVTPSGARRLGIGEEGTAPVAVQPLSVPRER